MDQRFKPMNLLNTDVLPLNHNTGEDEKVRILDMLVAVLLL